MFKSTHTAQITVYFLSKLLMSKSLNVLQISGPTFNLFLDLMLIAAIIRKSKEKKRYVNTNVKTSSLVMFIKLQLWALYL